MKTVGVLGGYDCCGKVIVLDVEAVSHRRVVNRRVLTAGVSIPPGGVAQGGLLIAVISSEFGVDGGGVEQNDGHGSGTSRSGL